MNFLPILDAICDADFVSVLKIVRWAINIICIAIPIILIVLVIVDLAKVVTAGNIDDKMKKEVSQKVLTRVIYSVLIFLVPTIVSLFFRIVPISAPGFAGDGATWKTCWDAAGN